MPAHPRGVMPLPELGVRLTRPEGHWRWSGMRPRDGHGPREWLPELRPLGAVSAVAAFAAVLIACAGGTSGASTTPAASATSTGSSGGGAGLQQEYVNTIHQVLPSVVEIRTSSGLGSGVVYDTAGHIMTNAHVVGSATSF